MLWSADGGTLERYVMDLLIRRADSYKQEKDKLFRSVLFPARACARARALEWRDEPRDEARREDHE